MYVCIYMAWLLSLSSCLVKITGLIVYLPFKPINWYEYWKADLRWRTKPLDCMLFRELNIHTNVENIKMTKIFTENEDTPNHLHVTSTNH